MLDTQQAILLEPQRQGGAPEHGQVRLGGGPQVVQGLQEAEARLGHQRAPVVAHAADRLGDPRRVPREQRVVLRRAQEAHHAQLDDEVVDELLGLLLGEHPSLEVALEVDVEEGRDPAQAHGRAVLLLDRAEVGHVQPLDGFMRGHRGPAQVQAVHVAELDELGQRADLLVELLPVPDYRLGGQPVVQGGQLGPLGLGQPVDAVERDAAVVTDDPAPAVGVRQAGHDVAGARGADRRGVGVEHALVVRLAVLGEDLGDPGVDLVAVGLQAALDHAPAAVGHDRALEGRVGLQADDQLGDVGGDPARRMRGDRAGGVHVDVEDAALALDDHQVGHEPPQLLGALAGPGQEGVVALVRGVVAADERHDVDGMAPLPVVEALPGIGAGGGPVGGDGHVVCLSCYGRAVGALRRAARSRQYAPVGMGPSVAPLSREGAGESCPWRSQTNRDLGPESIRPR